MANVTYHESKYWQKEFPIQADRNLFLRNSLRYAGRFERFSNAIVPNTCYQQRDFRLRGGGGKSHIITIFHASLPFSLDLSQCHKFLWSARHGNIERVIDSPDNLEVFIILTCIEYDPDAPNEPGVPHGEMKTCDILFPGIWATQLWRKHLCLWHRKSPLLQTNPLCPGGLLYAEHRHLQAVLGDFATE